MNIRPRNIQKYQGGGTFNLADWIAQNPTYYEWYKGIYPNALVLAGDPLKLNLAHANYSKVSSSHHTTDDLQRSAYNNYLYTSPDLYVSRESDILNWATKNNINLSTISDEDFVNTYNKQAQTIRDAREAPQTYNRTGYTGTNQTFRNMFGSRSQQGTNHPLYNIGYLENLEDIEGTSTWQRRMDRYEKRFLDDTPENQKNRTFYITRPDGRKIKVYKKENGDLGLFNDPNDPNSPKDPNPEQNPQQNPELGKVPVGQSGNESGRVPVGLGDWDKKNILSNFDWKNVVPGALNIGRLWNTLNTNKKVYDHMKKAIFPVLQQSYHTHRQVVGDEATKQAYYTRAAQGLTKAARPFTADADRQMAYLMEAKRVGDQLRAEGDLADNKEIRRTSDESMQHAWQNIARDTQVANENILSIGKAKAALEQLNAQRASALGTSLDNWLKEAQYNFSKRRQEEIAYQDQLDLYDMAYSRLNDPDRKKLEKVYDDAEEAYSKNKSQANYNKVLESSKALKSYDLNWMKLWLINHPPRYSSTYFFGKRGGKFDHDAELLYKVSRDAVKHFREMSKQTDNSRIKTLPKAVKLKDPPKSRKYQYGGQAPFMVYTPLALGGGESTTASASGSTKGSSSDKKDKHDTFDVVKDLFKEIAGKGLPSDVSVAYDLISALLRRVQTSGDSLDSDDLASMYLKQMQVVNNLQFEKAKYDDVLKRVDLNKGLEELAVDNSGRLIGQDKDGNIKRIRLSELKNLKEEFTPFTNEQLLKYRAYSPNKAFDTEILEIVNNGVGLEKISEYIKANIGNIGTSEFLQEGYSKKEAEQIVSGIAQLQQAAQQGLAMAPDGTYKGEYLNKNSLVLMAAAINYIKKILPDNMKTILAIHSTGETIEQAISLTITEAVGSRVNSTVHYNFDAVTGKAAKDANGNNKSDDSLEINSATLLLLGMSSPREFTFSIGNGNAFLGMARVSSINDVNETPFGADFSYKDIYKSTLRKNLDLDNACFGDVPINKSLKDKIIVDNSTIAGVDLPYSTDSSGRIIPDFAMLAKIEEADKEVLSSGSEGSPQKINEIYAKHGLPIKYGANNQLTNNYKRFAVIQATAIEDVFLNKSGLSSNSTLELVTDLEEVENYIRNLKEITKEKNINLDRPGIFTGNKDIFKGSIFIPIIGDLTDSISGSKVGKLTGANYDTFRNEWNTRNYVKPPIITQ